MGWATEEEAAAITGRDVSPAALAVAQIIVEIFAGTTELASDNERIASRNLLHLTRAVAFQGAWLDSHPDVLDTMDVQGVSQDGLNAQYANANAHLLAPLAKRCIDRLSWRAEIRVRRPHRHHGVSDVGNRDSAVRDDQFEWSVLPFGATP